MYFRSNKQVRKEEVFMSGHSKFANIKHKGEKNVIEDVYLDMLVSVMDRNIEKTDDYEKRISDTYDIIRY